MDFFLCLLLVAFFFLYSKLSNRIRQCEQSLEQIKKALLDTKQSTQQAPSPPPAKPLPKPPSPDVIPTIQQPQIKPATKSSPQAFQKEQMDKFFDKWSKALNTLKENWMGVFGSLAIVIGTVFFGLTSQIMQYPQMRVAIMMFASFIVLWISKKMKGKEGLSTISGWLKSIAGAVILFATLGAGGIEGLKFIDSPFYALVFLCLGVAINLIISTTVSSQAVASLHVILSILAFCIVPQSIILLPIGALVTIIGLLAAYRSNWNIHLLLIILAFAFQNSVLTFTLGQELLPWMHHVAIASSIAVGLIAGLIPYSKKYESSTIEGGSLAAHISNWGLLTWNIWLHASFFKGTPFVLAAIAIAGFLLARVAKKRNILWLYYTDTILAQLVAMLAIVWLAPFSINLLDLGLLLLIETILFTGICSFMKEDILSRAGYFFQLLCCLIMMGFIASTFNSSSDYNGVNLLRVELFAALNWGFHLIVSWKNFPIDDLKWIFLADKKIKNPISITAVFGTFIFLISYLLGFDWSSIQCWTLIAIGGIGVWRKWQEGQTWNLTLILSLVFLHLFNWVFLLLLLSKDSSFSLLSRVDSLGIVLLDLFLIFGNFLYFKLWKRNLHSFLVYALGIQLGLLTYVTTQPISLLIPGLVFLGFSLIFLESGRLVSTCVFYSEDVKEKMRESMIHVGLAFLFGFLVRFIMVNLQIDPIWHGLSLRLLTEILGLFTLLYWLAFYPQQQSSVITQFIDKRLVEVCLGFLTLCIFVEMPEMWRPLSWIFMAIGLLVGTLHYNWPQRLFLYSWGYFIASIIHVAFVTSTLNMPYLFLFERFYFPAILAIILQFCYAYLVQKTKHAILSNEKEELGKKLKTLISSIYHLSPLTIILPAFLGVALLFAFNFEKAILTLLWVGLICIYLCVGLFIKSQKSIQIAMLALLFCSIRLIVFDLMQSDLAIRALVFIGVGALMLGISFLYKKYKHRIEDHEEI